MPSNDPSDRRTPGVHQHAGVRLRSFLSLVAILTLIAATAVVLAGAPTAFACSCLFPGTAEAIAESDVVFTGSMVAQAGSVEEPLWTFAVDGVVHGDVGSTVEVRGGAIDGAGCGPDFAQLDGPITVFVDVTDDGLQTSGCRPNPPADEFESELAALEVPTIDPPGVGPPAAVMVGVQGPYDLSVLDAEGGAMARANVGAHGRAVAHCPGTTRVALSPRQNLHTVVIVDLTTMEVIDERPTDGPAYSSTGDRMTCLDGGDRVITAVEDYAGGDSIDVTVSDSGGSGDVTRRFDGSRRAVIDVGGTVLLLPSAAGGAIRTLAADDLAPAGEDVALPEGAAAVDADISPDANMLAVLTTTTTGSPATVNVVTFSLNAGVIDTASVQVVPVVPSNAGTVSASVTPTALRWAGSDTWLIEYGAFEGSVVADDRYLTFVTTDGTETVSPIAAGASRGLVTIDGGVLRSRLNGAELVDREGGTTDLYPAPNEDGTIDFVTFLGFDDLTGSPPFEPPSPPNAPVAIKPVDPNAPPVTTATTPEPSETETAPTEQTVLPIEQPDGSRSDAVDDAGRSGWVVGVAVILAVVSIVGVAAWSRRRRSSD